MSWCPNCKNEYRVGITVCPDCNVALVEELSTEINYISLFQTDHEELKDKILRYMEHCGIASRFETSQVEEFIEEVNNEENVDETTSDTRMVTLYTILVDKNREKDAAKELMAVLSVESSQNGDGPTAVYQKKKSIPQPSTVYVNVKDRYSEYRSSGVMFICFGVVILLFAVLNLIGIITVMAGIMSLVLLGILSIAFIAIGISSFCRSKSLRVEATNEENEKEQIITFLKSNFTKEVIDSLVSEELTPELLFLKQLEIMKEQTVKEFSEADELLIDTLLEDYMNTIE